MTEETAGDGGGTAGADSDADSDAVRSRAARDRRRRRVFGDLLDDATLDDRPDPVTGTEGDRWLRDNVPPHHGG